MDKKDFQNLFKAYMKERGFKIKGNCAYQFIDDQYIIGIYLDHHPYTKGYFVEYGAIYEPDAIQRQKVLSGKCDFSRFFLFTADPDDDLKQHPIENPNCCVKRNILTDCFEYSFRTEADFKYSMDINMEKRFQLLYNKEYILDEYRRDWVYFRMIPYDTVHKIVRLTDLNIDEVIRFRDNLALFDLLKQLYELGIEVNRRDYAEKTALHVAAVIGNVDDVALLLKAGADVNAQDKRGFTALDLAMGNPAQLPQEELDKLLDFLIFHGAKSKNELSSNNQ